MQTLVIWLPDGNTLYFEEVENFQENSTTLKFTYTGLTTKVTREAVFDKSKTLGFALGNDDTRSELDQLIEKL